MSQENPVSPSAVDAQSGIPNGAPVVAPLTVENKFDPRAQIEAMSRWRTSSATMGAVCLILSMLCATVLLVVTAVRTVAPEMAAVTAVPMRINASAVAIGGAIWGVAGTLLWKHQRLGFWIAWAFLWCGVVASLAGIAIEMRVNSSTLTNALPGIIRTVVVTGALAFGMNRTRRALAELDAASVKKG